MDFFMYLIILSIIVSLPFAIPVILSFIRPAEDHSDKYKTLNLIGLITNILLGLLYVPLSLFGSLMGMIGEGYINTASAAQEFLIHVIEILAFLSPLVAMEGLLASVLLRLRKWAKSSFVIQFGLIFYLILIMVLAVILEYI